MNKRNIFTEEIIDALCKGQKISTEELFAIRNENNNMPDGILVFFVLNYFLEHPTTTDWKLLLNELEQILVKSDDQEQKRIVTQDILESFSNSISGKSLELKWIAPHLGPKSRDYLNKYEEFHGSGIKF